MLNEWKIRAEGLIKTAAAAVAAADPARATLSALPPAPKSGRVALLAAGKASLPMARAVAEAWGDLGGRLFGAVVTNDAAGADLPSYLEVIEASHPTPDARSAAGARRLLEIAQGLNREDFALALISGGGSALLAAPSEGLTLETKRAINDALLASGATIHEINAVRKRLSAIKGGRLAQAAHPAQLLTLAISDVPGDDPAVIASGPTAPDASSIQDAQAVIAKYNLLERLSDPAARQALAPEAMQETPKPGDPVFERTQFQIVASPAASIDAAVKTVENLGWKPVMLGAEIEGEARDVAAAHAERALAARAEAQAIGAPVALISGGELTVTISGQGRGGPNREYALALAAALNGAPDIAALAMDTDGADGAPAPDGAPVAGALVFPDTPSRAQALGLDLAAALADNDAGGAFAALGDDLRTGYTGTNVNDLRLILVTPG